MDADAPSIRVSHYTRHRDVDPSDDGIKTKVSIESTRVRPWLNCVFFGSLVWLRDWWIHDNLPVPVGLEFHLSRKPVRRCDWRAAMDTIIGVTGKVGSELAGTLLDS